jgi:hypothetical protein
LAADVAAVVARKKVDEKKEERKKKKKKVMGVVECYLEVAVGKQMLVPENNMNRMTSHLW